MAPVIGAVERVRSRAVERAAERTTSSVPLVPGGSYFGAAGAQTVSNIFFIWKYA